MGVSMSSDVSPVDLGGPATVQLHRRTRMTMKSRNQQRQPLRLTLLLQPAPGVSRLGSLLGAEVSVPLLAIEDAKSDECYGAPDMISGALDQLGEHKELYMLCEYANGACQRAGGRINIPGEEFNYCSSHPSQVITVNLGDLMPCLDDYTMCRHNPFLEDFIWCMDDSRHTESISKELIEADVPQLHIFAERSTINAARSAASSAAAEVAGRDNQGFLQGCSL